MQQQNDWYTGIDYFQSYKEQDIQVEEQSLALLRCRSHGMNAWSSGMF